MKTQTEFNFNNIAVLNGGVGLSGTECAIFRKLQNNVFSPLLIDNLHKEPTKLALLKTNGIKTIITGTLVNETLQPLFSEFEKLNWLPENAIITRGEDLFKQFEDKVNMFVLMPMNFSTDEIEMIPFSEW